MSTCKRGGVHLHRKSGTEPVYEVCARGVVLGTVSREDSATYPMNRPCVVWRARGKVQSVGGAAFGTRAEAVKELARIAGVAP